MREVEGWGNEDRADTMEFRVGPFIIAFKVSAWLRICQLLIG